VGAHWAHIGNGGPAGLSLITIAPHTMPQPHSHPGEECWIMVEGESVLVDTTGTLVFGGRRLVAAIGLEDVIIVDTEDALLVCPRSRAQDVRTVVEALKRARKTRYL